MVGAQDILRFDADMYTLKWRFSEPAYKIEIEYRCMDEEDHACNVALIEGWRTHYKVKQAGFYRIKVWFMKPKGTYNQSLWLAIPKEKGKPRTRKIE